MRKACRAGTAVVATLIALTPFSVSAQDTVNATDTAYVQPEEDDDEFPWGLLGLLGLAGLIPRKRHDTVHVDNRTRP